MHIQVRYRIKPDWLQRGQRTPAHDDQVYIVIVDAFMCVMAVMGIA